MSRYYFYAEIGGGGVGEREIIKGEDLFSVSGSELSDVFTGVWLMSSATVCLTHTRTHTHEHQYANSTTLLRPYKFLQHSPHFAVSYDLREDAGSHSEISVCASVCVCGCVCCTSWEFTAQATRKKKQKTPPKKQTHAFLETGECFLICSHTMSNPPVWLLKHQQCFSRGWIFHHDLMEAKLSYSCSVCKRTCDVVMWWICAVM